MTLSRLLNLQRPLIVLDTETTVLDTSTARIIELAFQAHYPSGSCGVCEGSGAILKSGVTSQPNAPASCSGCLGTGQRPVKEYRTLVNPGVPIPAESTKVHGITDVDFKKCRTCGVLLETHPIGKASETIDTACVTPSSWPTFTQLAANLVKGFADCDYAGKNIRFDLRILTAEFARAGIEWSYIGAYVLDADRLEAIAVPRSLSHLHKKYVGREHDGAHGAMSDTRAAATVIVRQLEEHPAALPRDLKRLHELSWPGWLCDGNQFRIVDGVAVCQFGKHRGKAMKVIPIDYYDWLLKSDFPADVKQLAREAKLGRFPNDK